MKGFTYENENRNEELETYEWDNTWIDHADDTKTKRVLYIGDSISCATRTLATAQCDEKILFDGFGTSKGLDNPFFKECIKIFGKQQGQREVILFNNGLHGWHLDDETEYGYHYEEMIKFLLEEFKNTPLFVVLTTHIADSEREKRVLVRNKVAQKIAEKYNLPVIDLYEVSSQKEGLLSQDGVHLTTEGYELLAEKIVSEIKTYLM
ncbi:MAG: hypothetical protein II997_02815 [Clostridia bacterium]|nr:hypothetical protein [Clostridia bacterium]